MAGYSATPLIKKLGIKPGFDVAFVNAPEDFVKQLDLPSDVSVRSHSKSDDLDFILVFVRKHPACKRTLLKMSYAILAWPSVWST